MDLSTVTYPALIPNVPEHVYHGELTADKGWFSSSLAKRAEKSCWRAAMRPTYATAAMIFGQCVHAFIDAKKKGRGIVGYYPADGKPDPARGNKLPKADFARAERCAEAVLTDPASRAWVDGAVETELTALWTLDGVNNKAKLDLLNGLTIVDVKTTSSVEGDDFPCQANRLRYDLNSAQYLSGPFGFNRYVFIAVESDGDHDVRIYEYDQESLAAASKRLSELRSQFKRCLETRDWPSYPREVTVMRSWRAGRSS